MQRTLISTAGTDFTYYEAPSVPVVDVNVEGDKCLHTRLYTYRVGEKVVSGWTMSVMFTVDRPAKAVWPHLKDFNAWQNSYGHFYSGLVGDLEGKSFRLGSKPDDMSSPYPNVYEVIRSIPEQLIVLSQPIPAGGGNGDVSPGFHVFMLSEYDDKTIVTVLMDHAFGAWGKTEDEALTLWRQEAPEYQRKWRDVFIPNLKRLVYESE